MRKWDKNTLSWEWKSIGLATSIASDGEFDRSLAKFSFGSDRRLHKLYGIEAVSEPYDKGGQRRGNMTLEIRQSNNTAPATESIAKRLSASLLKMTECDPPIRRYGVHIILPKTESWTDSKFILSFPLADGEEFCDSSIEIARAVFEALGIDDERGYMLAKFSHKRESFVMIDDAWITFTRWLRMSHRLPIYGPEDNC